MSDAGNQAWLVVCGAEDLTLGAELTACAETHLHEELYSRSELMRIQKMDLSPCRKLNVSDKKLEKLRRLCQIWDVDLRNSEITSHRSVIGPLIVAVKRMVFPILRVLLKDTLRQQREFNATVIELLARED